MGSVCEAIVVVCKLKPSCCHSCIPYSSDDDLDEEDRKVLS